MAQEKNKISVEDCNHSFIVRIWCEKRDLEGAPSEWRGMIEHVTSGKRNYLKDVDEIAAAIVPYLERLGLNPRPQRRILAWLRWLKMNRSRRAKYD